MSTALATAMLLAASIFLVGDVPKQASAIPSIDLSKKGNIIQRVLSDDSSVESIDLWIKKKTSKTVGEISIEVLQDGQVLASDSISTDNLNNKKKFTKVTVDLGSQVARNFDLKVSFEGNGGIKVLREKASKSSFDGYLVGKKSPKGWNLKLAFNTGNNGQTDNNQDNSPSQQLGQITVYAYRIPSEYWGTTFKEANAAMYFVVYNSDGDIIHKGFADEDGTTISGLQSGTTYWVYPTDCEKCHGGDHDVIFDHWENGSTERPRPVVAMDNGASVGAYYRFVPPPN